MPPILPPLDLQFLIPLIFVFAIVFGALSLANVFKNRAVNAVIAFAIALFVATQEVFRSMLFEFLPILTGFFIVIFIIGFVMKFIGYRRGQGDELQGMMIGGVVLFLLFTVGYWLLIEEGLEFPIIGGGEELILILGIIFIGSLFWGAFKVSTAPQAQPQQKG